jgi:maltodextrin utilization protein YvdJ
MFLYRYFKFSFSFSTLFTHGKEALWKMLVYLGLLSMMAAFPLNYLIVREQGWRLDFIEESFIQEVPDWQLPNDCEIRASRLVCESNTKSTYEHRGITYVFNGTDEDLQTNLKTIVLMEEAIVYVNAGAEMTSEGYAGFSETVKFRAINLMDGDEKDEAMQAFATALEDSFSSQIVFYTLIINSVITLLSNIMFILLLSIVLQMFRFGFSTFMTYGETIRFLILVMGLPAVLSLIVGLFIPAFSTVFFQLAMGLVTMLVMLVYGRKTFA